MLALAPTLALTLVQDLIHSLDFGWVRGRPKDTLEALLESLPV